MSGACGSGGRCGAGSRATALATGLEAQSWVGDLLIAVLWLWGT